MAPVLHAFNKQERSHGAALEAQTQTRLRFLELAYESAAKVIACIGDVRQAALNLEKSPTRVELRNRAVFGATQYHQLAVQGAFVAPDLEGPLGHVRSASHELLRIAGTIPKPDSEDPHDSTAMEDALEQFGLAEQNFLAAVTAWKGGVWQEFAGVSTAATNASEPQASDP